MKVVSKVSFFPSNPVEGGYYYNTVASTLGIYKDGNWSFNYPLVESGKKEEDLAFDINGFYPLYFTEDEAKNASSLSTAHSHEIDGVTYYMPDGGTEGKDFFHGTFGNTYYWYQKQGPLPSWITPPPQGAIVTQALEQLVNPDTGETYTVPTGGYTVNVANPSPVVPSTYSITFSHDGNSDSTTPNPTTNSYSDGTVITLSSTIGSFQGPKSGYQFDKWVIWRGSPIFAPVPEWSATADYYTGDRVYVNDPSGNPSVYISLQDALVSGGGTPQQPDLTPNYWQPAGALDNADSLTDAKFTVNGSDAEIRATFTAVAQPVSPPAYTDPYDYMFTFLNAPDISGYGQNTYLVYEISGEDKDGSVSGFTSQQNPQTLELNVGDKVWFRMSVGYNRVLENHPVIINYGNSLSKEVTIDNQGLADSLIEFNQVGTFTYSCKNHSTMMGNINVS